MSALRFTCPNKGVEIDSGIDIDAKSFEKIRDQRLEVRCPLCNAAHEFRVSDGQINELRVA